MDEGDKKIAITVFFSIATCIYVSFIGFLAHGHWTFADRDATDCGGMIFLCAIASGLTCAGICTYLTIHRPRRGFFWNVCKMLWAIAVSVAIVRMLMKHA
jgi:hypothetical protein